MSDSSPHGTATWKYWQAIGNDVGARASFQDRPPVTVRARTEWAQDGVEWIAGSAFRLGFDGSIFVELKDRRCSTLGVWLAANDVWWEGKQDRPEFG